MPKVPLELTNTGPPQNVFVMVPILGESVHTLCFIEYSYPNRICAPNAVLNSLLLPI